MGKVVTKKASWTRCGKGINWNEEKGKSKTQTSAWRRPKRNINDYVIMMMHEKIMKRNPQENKSSCYTPTGWWWKMAYNEKDNKCTFTLHHVSKMSFVSWALEQMVFRRRSSPIRHKYNVSAWLMYYATQVWPCSVSPSSAYEWFLFLLEDLSVMNWLLCVRSSYNIIMPGIGLLANWITHNTRKKTPDSVNTHKGRMIRERITLLFTPGWIRLFMHSRT